MISSNKFEFAALRSQLQDLQAKYAALVQVLVELRERVGLPVTGDGWSYDVRLPLSAVNLYPLEYLDDGVKRWVGPQPRFNVLVNLERDRNYNVEIAVVDFVLKELEPSFSLYVDGLQVPWVSCAKRLFKAAITPARTGLAELTFACANAVSPHELDPKAPDKRQLSFSFAHIKVEPSHARNEF